MADVLAVVDPAAVLLTLVLAPELVAADERVDDAHRARRTANDLAASEDPLRARPRRSRKLHAVEKAVRGRAKAPGLTPAIVDEAFLDDSHGAGRCVHVVVEQQRPVGGARVRFNRATPGRRAEALPGPGEAGDFQAHRLRTSGRGTRDG